MSWNELSEDELSQVSYRETASGVVIMRRPGVPKIYVERQIPRGSKGFLLRISPEFHDDMRNHVVGSLTTAITAILEEQFDVLKTGIRSGTSWKAGARKKQEQERVMEQRI